MPRWWRAVAVVRVRMRMEMRCMSPGAVVVVMILILSLHVIPSCTMPWADEADSGVEASDRVETLVAVMFCALNTKHQALFRSSSLEDTD